MSLVFFILDKSFSLLMWFLLDPVGRKAFWALESFIFLVGVFGIYLTFRKESED